MGREDCVSASVVVSSPPFVVRRARSGGWAHVVSSKVKARLSLPFLWCSGWCSVYFCQGAKEEGEGDGGRMKGSRSCWGLGSAKLCLGFVLPSMV